MANIRNEAGIRGVAGQRASSARMDLGGVEAWARTRERYLRNMEDLMRTAQGAATKAYEQGIDAVQQLASCRNPTDFTETYFRLAREGMETTLSEGRRMAEQMQTMMGTAISNAESASMESAKSNVAQAARQ